MSSIILWHLSVLSRPLKTSKSCSNHNKDIFLFLSRSTQKLSNSALLMLQSARCTEDRGSVTPPRDPGACHSSGRASSCVGCIQSRTATARVPHQQHHRNPTAHQQQPEYYQSQTEAAAYYANQDVYCQEPDHYQIIDKSKCQIVKLELFTRPFLQLLTKCKHNLSIV